MKNLFHLAVVLGISLLAVTGVSAQKKSSPQALAQSAAKAAAAAIKNPQIKFQDIKLKNGLRVLLVEDHSAPVILLVVNYNVGSRDEKKGRTGFAHLFEHKMFQGSENVGKSEHFMLIDNNGGQMNGTTNTERTIYFETLPANQLDLAIFLESDRMKSLDISQANLDNQRNAVQEERRLRLDNQPYGKANEQFGELMYDNFAYKHSVIGSMEDLSAATVNDVRDFFRLYYAPNNAVLALVGDFKSADALNRIKKQFEAIPAQPTPPPVDINEPAQNAERRMQVDDSLAQLPLLRIGYKGLIGNTLDAYAMTILNTVLSGGQSSRLYQKIVKEKQLALQIGGFAQAGRGAGSYNLQAIIAPGKKSDEVEAIINEEISRMQTEPIADWELEKAKSFARRSTIGSMNGSLSIGMSLAQDAIAYNDPNLINTRLQKLAVVTKDDVMRVAKKYLQANNRTVLLAQPKPKAGAPAAGGTK